MHTLKLVYYRLGVVVFSKERHHFSPLSFLAFEQVLCASAVRNSEKGKDYPLRISGTHCSAQMEKNVSETQSND